MSQKNNQGNVGEFIITLDDGQQEIITKPFANEACFVKITVSGLTTSELKVYERSIKDGSGWDQILEEDGVTNPFVSDGARKIEFFSGAEMKFDLSGGSDTGVIAEVAFRK